MGFTNRTAHPLDCSVHPTFSEPNQDITGIGISLSWAITAGLALCLVIANYFVAYRPDLDPFGSQAQHAEAIVQSAFKPNPIDSHLLGWRLRANGQIGQTSGSAEARKGSQERRTYIREALTQCMLTMSDYQLITGLAVLISGYSQLPSGLSTEHWERIIDLAWFSSITHLCCLTFLREYFYRNRRAQIWRIPGMIILITLLSVALIPSAHYVDANVRILSASNGFDGDRVYYNTSLDYAKCFFNRRMEGHRGDYYRTRATRIDVKRQNVIVSAVILIFGMTNRIWRLFETSTNVYQSARQWLSRHVKVILRQVFDQTMPRSKVLADLIYRPMLTSYLMFHVLLSILLSKAFEVWWLVIGLFWGLTNLIPITEAADQEWTFGQVIAALMLVLPVISLIETLATLFGRHQSKSTSVDPAPVPTPTQPTLTPSTMQQGKSPLRREDPEHDFYNLSLSFIVAVYVIVAFIAAMSLLVLVSKALGGTGMRPWDMIWAFNGTPNLLLLFYTMACILCSLPIDQLRPESKPGRVAVGICSFCLYAGFIGGGFALGLFPPYAYYGLPAPFAIYLVLLVVEQSSARTRSSTDMHQLGNHANESAVLLETLPTSVPDSAHNDHTAAPTVGLPI